MSRQLGEAGSFEWLVGVKEGGLGEHSDLGTEDPEVAKGREGFRNTEP